MAETTQMFSYAQLEAAMRQLHRIPDSKAGTFKSRLRNFQRLGLIRSAPGKGIQIAYSVAEAVAWSMCFELAEAGISPEGIRSVFDLCGAFFYDPFCGPVKGEDLIFVLKANFLQWHLSAEGRPGEGETTYGLLPLSRVMNETFVKSEINRAIMINMTDVRRRLGDVLKIDWDDYDARDPKKNPAIIMSRSMSRGAAGRK